MQSTLFGANLDKELQQVQGDEIVLNPGKPLEKGMKVVRARTAGFCMGVGLALNKLEQALKNNSGGRGTATAALADASNIAMWGPIIHNPQVLADFTARGVRCLTRLEDVRPGDLVLIRAHGIPVSEEKALLERGAEIVDATCPKVKKAQLVIAEATQSGASLLLFGEAAHPEVRGLVSYAGGACVVFSGSETADLEKLPGALPPGKGVVLAAQTTQELASFAAAAAWLQNNIPGLRVLSTICEATSKRQKEVMDIARQVDMMIVAGGQESGNTRRLADVARMQGVPTLHVESLAELEQAETLRDCAVVGLTAGASTPGTLVDAMQRFLECLDIRVASGKQPSQE